MFKHFKWPSIYSIWRLAIALNALAAVLYINSPYASLGFLIGCLYSVLLDGIYMAERNAEARREIEAMHAKLIEGGITIDHKRNPIVRL